MNARHCHRCDTELHIESEGAIVYCFHCGAPQIFLSEELQQQNAERMRVEQQSAEGESYHPLRAHSPHAIRWNLIMRLGAAVAAVLAALSIVLPPLGLLVFAWSPVVPAAVISLYATRLRDSRFSAAIGARIGALCGFLIGSALLLVNTLKLGFERFVLHNTNFDAAVNTVLTQAQSQAVAQSGPEAADMFKLFTFPEFRAGFFLAAFGLMSLMVLLLAIGGGAIAGSLRQRRRVS